jgi:hypothetical protein
MLSYGVLNNKKAIYSEWLQNYIYNLGDATFVIPDTYSYDIFTVSDRYVARPDLISLDAYDDANFADVICKLNGISNPFELNKDMILILPSPECVIDFINRLNSDEIDQNIDERVSVPVAKPKNSKRKANEAIIGDKRFKIDQNNGIIIY